MRKNTRGGRRKNQTGRPPKLLHCRLGKKNIQRLMLIAGDKHITVTKMAEEYLRTWAESDEIQQEAARIEAELAKKKPPEKPKRKYQKSVLGIKKKKQ